MSPIEPFLFSFNGTLLQCFLRNLKFSRQKTTLTPIPRLEISSSTTSFTTISSFTSPSLFHVSSFSFFTLVATSTSYATDIGFLGFTSPTNNRLSIQSFSSASTSSLPSLQKPSKPLVMVTITRAK